MNMLRYVASYVTFGTPNQKTVKELIYKRGYARVGGFTKSRIEGVTTQAGTAQRIPLSDNEVIDRNLGAYGIKCMEDLVHEIYTVGPHFKQANAFLWPFKLSSPRHGFVHKNHGFAEPAGGDWGNRDELINELIRRMN